VADERDLTEHTIESKTAYRGRLLHVREDRVRLPDGSESRREYIVHPGAAVMLAMPDAASVLMERQYRYALRQHVYELPAGKIDRRRQYRRWKSRSSRHPEYNGRPRDVRRRP
jgi:ADP-ribose pyrophosphatase